MVQKLELFYEYLLSTIIHAIKLGRVRDDSWYAFLNDIFKEKNLEYRICTNLLDAVYSEGVITKEDYLLIFGIFAWLKGNDEQSATLLEQIILNRNSGIVKSFINGLVIPEVIKVYLQNLFGKNEKNN